MKHETRLRTHTCGELTIKDVGKTVTLCGWIAHSRDLGGMTFIDLRDRYGITQLVFNHDSKDGAGIDANEELCEQARKLGREFVLKVTGKVTERSSKNLKIHTGEIEIIVEKLEILNESKVPPFTIEDETDGGDDLRMSFRYLDLRRKPIAQNIILRHRVAQAVREYFDTNGFTDVETPFLIKSTPEGARDFVVPSRLNQGEFYALPQSPQTFKQLLMVAGFDKYYQIVRCFRDEDLRADRQPEFTQIDCEMSFVEQDDILFTFENMVKYVFKKVRNIELHDFPKISYADALKYYGTDKPDLRFEMKLVELNDIVKGKEFKVFNEAELVAGICAEGCATNFTRKQLDELTEFVKRPQIGAKGMAWLKYNTDGTLKSSFDKFYSSDELKKIAERFSAKAGDLILILAGTTLETRKALGELRLEMGNRLNMRSKDSFKPLWVIDFPLLEWIEKDKQWTACHHPFTSWKKEDEVFLDSDPGKVRANAYDVVINGVELASGSIRIHDRKKQEKMFELIGLTKEEIEKKFGFILSAFEYGAPPHGGIAFGFDRFCSIIISNLDCIRDFIAFPKNNSGRDVMLDSPSTIDIRLSKELGLK
ncbi:MAG: aspartate--tRNA ligase [Bacteroidota bacterium]